MGAAFVAMAILPAKCHTGVRQRPRHHIQIDRRRTHQKIARQIAGPGRDIARQRGGAFQAEVLTFDHIIPRSKGGRTLWDNVVTACAPCNLKKGHRSLKKARMGLLRRPERPTNYQLQENGRAFPPNYLHESWGDFLYWDTELEP